MENKIDVAITELIRESEEKKEGAKKALDIVQGFLSIASQVDDSIKVKDLKEFIGRIQGGL